MGTPSNPSSGREDAEHDARKRRPFASIGVLITTLLLAAATAIGTGLGSAVLDVFHSDKAPVSYSAEELVSECGTGLFVPEDRARAILSRKAGVGDWKSFQRSHHAIVASPGAVEVSIQGESSRKITLTRINITAERRPRPRGASFAQPCGDSLSGRQVVADLDRQPVALVASSRNSSGVPGGVDNEGHRVKPIVFPWTVSVTDPLLLMIVATTKECYCTWRAEIPWRSGGESGVIKIDNNGRGYSVVGTHGGDNFVGGSSSWTRLPE